MNTILFEETALCRRGFAEYGERHGGLYIKYSIEFKENITDIFKLTALSSKKPFAVPIVADTAVVENLPHRKGKSRTQRLYGTVTPQTTLIHLF